MADINLSLVKFDPAVGVSSTEDMTEDLLHAAVRNPLFVGFTWTPLLNNATELAGGISLYAPVVLPGAKVEVCCIAPLVLSTFDLILDGETLATFQSVFEFGEPMKTSGGYPPSATLGAIAEQTRSVILRARETVRSFTAFYRIIGGE